MLSKEASPGDAEEIAGPLTRAAIFLLLRIDFGGEDVVKDLLADLPGLRRSVGFRSLTGGLSCLAGIGSAAWDRVYGGPRPAELHELPVFKGERHESVTSDADLLFHFRADRMDLCFELETLIMARLAGAVTVVDEVQGFRYFDARDVLGFVDGTENPTGRAARAAVYVDDDGGFDGGSYVVVQKYLHDMTAWNALSTEEQERVIGRRKLSDVELSDAEKPSDSHIALNVITDDDGNELDILRDNMPFGRPAYGEFGTYFIGYAKSPVVIERMLENMFVGSPPGNHDRILDFSTPHTGALLYVPTADFLENPPEPEAEAEEQAAAPEAEPETAPEPDDSLGIGGLREAAAPSAGVSWFRE
ncbi:Dyp-type peroxidase [Amycolatopsis sp. WQ 127309]|uniref:Dyp-type peroxidase n=1 Tax=Amycolatopsis sp. WQ 127309 TaxID=2932773 RepID=UPI001FF6E4DC|nr:Dyp-type peroxidase [Amycolatopsis sp. WQ 127309]UOZ03830.1 Dyp-type peroxidase [Amycolatopsis sp. WQ 127309]